MEIYTIDSTKKAAEEFFESVRLKVSLGVGNS